MAEEINIDLVINTADSASSIAQVKKSIKELNDAALKVGPGGKGFEDLSKKSAELKDKLEDLGDTMRNLKGSSVEKLNNSVGSLKDGFDNLDTDKISLGIKGVGNAVKTAGFWIFAIIEIVRAVVENFDKLKNSTGIIGKVFTAIGDIIGWLVQKFNDLTDAIGITSNASDELAATQIANAKKTGQAVSDSYDKQIAQARAAGKETEELEQKKQLAIIQTLKVEAMAIVAAARARGKFTDDENKRFTELIAETQKATDEIALIDIRVTKQKNDEKTALNKKYADDKKSADEQEAKDDEARLKESLAALDKLKQEQRDRDIALAKEAALAKEEQNKKEYDAAELETQDILSRQKSRAELIKTQNDETYAGRLENLQIERDAELKAAGDDEAAKFLIKEEYAEKEKQLNAQTAGSVLDIAQATTSSLQGLSDLVFLVKSKNLQKGSAAELEAAKKQFKINKALGIASAVISGIQGVVNALSAQSVIPEPFGTILKVATAVGVGIAAAVNVAKIASTQFNAGGGGGGGASVPTAAAAPAGNFQAQSLQAVGGAPSTPLVPNTAKATGRVEPQKIYVVSQDISSSQNKDAVLERRASFN